MSASGDSKINRGSISRNRPPALRRRAPVMTESQRIENASDTASENVLLSTDGRLTCDGGYVKKMVAELVAQQPGRSDVTSKPGRKVNRLKEMFEKSSPDSPSGSNWHKDAHPEHQINRECVVIDGTVRKGVAMFEQGVKLGSSVTDPKLQIKQPAKIPTKPTCFKTDGISDSSRNPELRNIPKPSGALTKELAVRLEEIERHGATSSKSSAEGRSAENQNLGLAHDIYCFKNFKQFSEDRAKNLGWLKSNGRESTSPANANRSIIQTPSNSDKSKEKTAMSGNITPDVSCSDSRIFSKSVLKTYNSTDSSFNIFNGDGLYRNISEWKSTASQSKFYMPDLSVAGHQEPNVEDDIYENDSTLRTADNNSSRMTSGVFCDEVFKDSVQNDRGCDDDERSNNDQDMYTNDSDQSQVGWGSDFSSEDSFDDSDWLVVCGPDNDADIYENVEPLCDGSTRSSNTDDGTSPSRSPRSQSRSPRSPLQNVIDEFVTTEETYVHVLHIIDQEFQQVLLLRNQKEELLSNELIPIIFSNINTLYELHKSNLLPNLKRCMIPTNSNPECRIGYVFKRIAPFLKLYSEYLCNFTKASNTLETCKKEKPKFAKFIQDIEKKPTCNQLGLHHHMLCTVQRIPRYELLLKDYIKHLPADSVDLEDAKKSLDLVTKAAQHSNEVMKMMDRQNKLFEISRSLSCGTEIVSPTRQLIKEGKMFILSKRDERQKERYFFLFNDVLLICKIVPFTLKPSYKVTAKLDVNGMEVVQCGSLSNTFYIMNKEHIIEVCPSSIEEKQAWHLTLTNTINRFAGASTSKPDTVDGTSSKNARRGVTAPLWIKDQQAPNCMNCNNEFNSILNRRHHCRACGSVICNSCSTRKMALEYKEFKESRVCDTCYNQMNTGCQILEMRIEEPSSMSGYLHESKDGGESWVFRWFALRNHILFSFQSRLSEEPSTTCIVLTGYRISRMLDNDLRQTFVLSHRKLKNHIYYRADSADDSSRWLEVLEQQLTHRDPTGLTSPQTPASRTNQSLLAEQLMHLVATETDA